MIIIGEKAYLKSYDSKMNNELNAQYEIGKQINVQKEENNKNKVTRKESKISNNDMYKNIRNKANILNQDHRDLQEKVSMIQSQEQEVQNIENTLKQVKSKYIQAIENGKQEEIKQKVKIKKIQKEADNLQQEYISEGKYLKDDSKILDTINESLKKINDIKSKLAKYKSKLISLENDIDKNKKEVENKSSFIQDYISKDEYINESIIINPLDFIFIENEKNGGIIINILI